MDLDTSLFPAAQMLRWLDTEKEIKEYESLLADFADDAETQQTVGDTIAALRKYQAEILTEKEARHWLLQIKNTPSLKRELEQERLIQRAFSELRITNYATGGEAAPAASGAKMIDMQQPVVSKKFNFTRILLAIAACLGLILVARNFVFNPKPDFETFAAALPDKPDFVHQGEGSDREADNKKFEENFRAGRFDAAIPFLEKHELDADSSKVRFWLGIAYLKAQPPKTAAAIAVFSKIQSGNSIYKKDAAWFLALAYWKSGDLEKAKTNAKQVPKGSKYYEQAVELMK